MTKTFCDRCEKEIVDKAFQVNTWGGELFNNIRKWEEKILCQPCFTALESFLNNK